MRNAHHTEIHWEHYVGEARESSSMRGQRRNQDFADQYLVFLGFSA